MGYFPICGTVVSEMTAPALESANWSPVHQALVAGSNIF